MVGIPPVPLAGTIWQDFDFRISENYHGKIFVVSCGNCRGMMASQASISLGYRQMVFEVQWILFSRFPQRQRLCSWEVMFKYKGKGTQPCCFQDSLPIVDIAPSNER